MYENEFWGLSWWVNLVLGSFLFFGLAFVILAKISPSWGKYRNILIELELPM